MKVRKSLVICFAALLAIGLGCGPRRGDEVLQSWETSNQLFKVRIRQFNERGFPGLRGLPGYYYVFEATTQDSPERWREVATIRTDDDVGIPRDQVRFLNARTGYFFMGQIYAITLDGGNLWSVWNAGNDREPDAFIKDVTVAPDGAGVMTFHPIPIKGQPQNLFTDDYGEHWKSK